MKILICGDSHISERSIPELTEVFNEILKIKADRFVQLGDFFEHNRPTPAELRFASSIVKKLKKKFKDVTIISGTGTHDLLHDISVIEFLKELDINAVKGDYVKDNILFAHYMLHESVLEYGSGKCGIKDLAKYNFVFLGHQHNPQDITKKIFHVGSVRYQNFNEVVDKFKRVAILENGIVKFVPLKSPYPMIDVHSLEELKKIEPGKKKVRLIINSFEQFKKEVNEIGQWRHKFNVFKIKLDFKNMPTTKPEKILSQSKKLKEILMEGIKKVKDEDVRKLLKGVLDEK